MRKLLWLGLALVLSFGLGASAALADGQLAGPDPRNPAYAPQAADIMAHCPAPAYRAVPQPYGDYASMAEFDAYYWNGQSVQEIKQALDHANDPANAVAYPDGGREYYNCFLTRVLELQKGAPLDPSFKPGTTTTPVASPVKPTEATTNDQSDLEKHHMTDDGTNRRCIRSLGETYDEPSEYYTWTFENICKFDIRIEWTGSDGITRPRTVSRSADGSPKLMNILTLKNHLTSWRELFD